MYVCTYIHSIVDVDDGLCCSTQTWSSVRWLNRTGSCKEWPSSPNSLLLLLLHPPPAPSSSSSWNEERGTRALPRLGLVTVPCDLDRFKKLIPVADRDSSTGQVASTVPQARAPGICCRISRYGLCVLCFLLPAVSCLYCHGIYGAQLPSAICCGRLWWAAPTVWSCGRSPVETTETGQAGRLSYSALLKSYKVVWMEWPRSMVGMGDSHIDSTPVPLLLVPRTIHTLPFRPSVVCSTLPINMPWSEPQAIWMREGFLPRNCRNSNNKNKNSTTTVLPTGGEHAAI
jgi:hypothetical protein